jgi:PBP1b-binding outer membrane lipoprotein LpoB
MKTYATILAALAMILTVGCSQDEGSAEKAGKAVDQAMEKAGNYTGEKMEEAGNAMERAGEDMKK